MLDLGNFNYPTSQIILALATAVGAFGGFPSPPQSFVKLTQQPIVQWGLLFVLIYQGGGSGDIKLSLTITALFYIIHRVLTDMENKN
jgi:hypothetical protein